jgi:hypothetical protein
VTLYVRQSGSPVEVGGGGGAAPDPDDAVRYLSGNGLDTNDGLSAGAPFLTIQAAYADLPATGVTIYVAPGRYDVGSTGMALARGKPVSIIGTVAPPPYINSSTQAPLSVATYPAAIFYTSASAVSLFTTTAGTAANRMDGCRWINLLFEFNDPATLNGIFANSVNYGEVQGCYFFADKTSTGIAAVDAVGVRVRATTPGTYGGDDASWWKIIGNNAINMALAHMGNETGTKYNSNFHVIRDNIGLGISHLNTSALPFITLVGTHRNQIGPNNIEAYNIGVEVTTSWGGRYVGDGGEFVDVMLDMYDCKCPVVDMVGITYGALGTAAGAGSIIPGALLVRGDAFVKGGVFILPTWDSANTQRVYPPIDDTSIPSIELGSNDNLILTNEHLTLPGGAGFRCGTGTPESAVLGTKGDMFLRTDGGAGTTLYVKESGTATNTGWIGYGAAGGGGSVATDAIWDAKGDLAGGTGANTAAKLTVGANDTILMAASGETTGLKWADAATSRTALGLGTLATASTVASADITNDTIVNADINTAAAIAYSKLALTNSIVAGDLTSDSVTNAKVADDAVGIAELSASGTADSTTYLRGDNSWATPAGGSSAVTIAARSTDASSITSSTTLVADSVMVVPINTTSGDMWFAEWFLLVNPANTTMDIKIGFTFPTSCTMSYAVLSSGTTSFSAFGAQAVATTPTGLSAQTVVLPFGTTTAALMPVCIGAWITGGGTSGNVAINYAQNTSDAGALVIKKGSFVRYSKIV